MDAKRTDLIDPRREELLFVATTPGLEPALEREVRRMGLGIWRVGGGVEVRGAPGLHRVLNLRLRTASRVLLRIASFPAKDVPTLNAGLQRTALVDFWEGRTPLELAVTAHRSKLSHAGKVRELAAKAWGAQLATASREQEEEGGGDALRLQLRLEDDVCTVSVDTSGELLYRRGYRQEISRAPLRETLAAGMLELAGYRGDEALWDPMCGSGTLPIEAALIALRRAPGIARTFAFERFPSHDARAWEELKKQARAEEQPRPPKSIRATDLHSGALGTARRNARRAGVLEHLTLERQDVTKPTALPSEPAGLLIANPPYGIRVGEDRELVPLYRALGDLLRERLPAGWRAAVLLPDPRLERALGLEVDDAFDVQNGGIRCQLVLAAAQRARG
ncbi:MAG: RNA methyltransferase [Myxococcaceae bacterium]